MSRRFSTWCVRGLCVFGVLVGGAAPGHASTRLVVAGAAGVSAQTHDQTLLVGLDAAHAMGEDQATLGAGIEARRRTFASDADETDALLNAQAGATLVTEGGVPVSLGLGGSVGPGAAIAPRAQLWLECAGRVVDPLTIGGRVWFQHFRDTDVLVLAPSVAFHAAPWTFTVSDYVALHDRGAVTHSALARVERPVGAAWTLEAGAGLGTGADYVGSPRVDIGRHALGLLGARLQWTDAASVRGLYTLRREKVGGVNFERHELAVMWMTTL